MKTLLVTFGCSWTYGVGAGYEAGMSKDQYKDMAWDDSTCETLSFRALICNKYGLENKNFSFAGSSNQAQFRRAKIFFSSKEFEQLSCEHNRIIVLWGITSTARNELFNLDTMSLENHFYSDEWPLCRAIVKFSYDHDNEVDLLSTEMHHWNTFFQKFNITNLWFDTFNHHNYEFPQSRMTQFKQDYERFRGNSWPTWEQYHTGQHNTDPEIMAEINDVQRWKFKNQPIQNLINHNQNPRDLMSMLAIKNGFDNFDNKIHTSEWKIDSNCVQFLVDAGLLNPISQHPTRIGHQQLAEILGPCVESVL